METRQQQRNKRPNHQSIKALTSFSGTTHTQRTSAVVEAERDGVPRLLNAEIEIPRYLPRLPRRISLRTAPVPSGELEIPLYVHVVRNTIIKHCLNTDAGIIYLLQLLNGGQTPSAVARKLQIGAIGAGLVPVHIRAVVLLGPHQPGGGVGPGGIQRGIGLGWFSGCLSVLHLQLLIVLTL